MLKETEKLIEILKRDYNINYNSVKEIDQTAEVINVGPNNSGYQVTKGMDEDKLDNLAMYINANTDKEDVIKEDNESPFSNDNGVTIEEKVSHYEDIEVGKVYKYEPEYVDNELESLLEKIAQYKPYCKVINKLITSKEDKEGLLEVTFDIDENKELGLGDLVNETSSYLVFDSDLKEVNSNESEEEETTEEIEIKEDYEEDIVEKPEFNVGESTSILKAIDSEREAVATYEFLINNSTDQEEIDLLTKILQDENEHIALLSALQAKKVASDVSEDNKEQLDEYATGVLESPAAE